MDLDSTPWAEPPLNLTEAQQIDHRFALRRWWRAVIVTLFWLLALAILAVWTANPVTLNRVQILEADAVLKVAVEDWATGRMRVDKSWKQPIDDKQIQITELPRDSQLAGTVLLIPITHQRGRWIVTPSLLPNGAPLVYPATPESERQLQSLLDTGRLPR